MNEIDENPVVSLIIPAYNSQVTVGRCLTSISQLNYPPDKVEVIVVDNGSKDQTPRIAEQHGAKVFVRTDIFVSQMRNIGVEQATGAIIGFVDSDCVLDPDWLRNGLRHLTNSKVGAAGCGYATNTPPCWIERHWFYMHLVPETSVNFLPAGNMLLRKEVFQQIGGFNPKLETGEDSDLCLRLRKAGLLVISDSGIRNTHLGNPKSLSTFLRKEIWYGRGLVACLNSHDWLDRTFLLTNIFLFGLFLLVAGIPLYFLSAGSTALVGGGIVVLFVIHFATIYRVIRRRNLSSFFPLVVLITTYFLGRSIALIQIYANLHKKKAFS